MSANPGVTVRTRLPDQLDHHDQWFATEKEAQDMFDHLKNDGQDYDILAMIEGNPAAVDIEDVINL
jgi:hypothetical protein